MNPDEPWLLPGLCPKLKGDEPVVWVAPKVLISGSFGVPNVKGDEGVVGWEALSAFPNVKAGLCWPNPDPEELNVNPVDGLGFSSNFPPKRLESPDAVPKLNGELVLPLLWPKLSTRPAKNESSFGRGAATSMTLVGLSSILTSSSSLGGVTGRGKLPNCGFCASAVLPNVKIPGLDVVCADSLNCGAAGFSGGIEEAPNLKANENAGFVSFGASLGTTAGDLADSPKDRVGAGCSRVKSFEFSVELVAPNPVNGVGDELPNENTDGTVPFCSGLVTLGLSSVVEAVGGIEVVEILVDSTAGCGPPNRLGSG